MIQHIVMWTLHNPSEAPAVKVLMETCKNLVPGMLQFEIGIRTDGLEANCDVLLNSRFTDAAALAAYQAHPHHKTVGTEVGKLRVSRYVLDYYVESNV